MELKILVLLFLIFLFAEAQDNQNSTQDCAQGCLQCGKTGVCSICDGFNRYFLTKTGCKRIEKPNCVYINSNADCVVCDNDHYLDTGNCLAVPSENKIQNCLHYQSQSTCSECSAGFYLEKKACVTVKQTIEGCEIYDTSGVACTKCQAERTISIDQKSCKRFSS